MNWVLIYGFHMTGNTDTHVIVTDNLKKKVGVWIRKPVSIWCDYLLHAARHISFAKKLIRLLIVACGMLSHSSLMAVWSCWILAGTGTCCRTRRSRHLYLYIFLFNEASQLRTNSYLQWRPTPSKSRRHWANCAPPYQTPNHSWLWYSLDLNQGVCGDASSTEMQCLEKIETWFVYVFHPEGEWARQNI